MDRSSDRKPPDAENADLAPPAAALVALSLCMLLSSLGTSITNVALPTFADVFGATFQQVQWIVLGYLLALTSLIVGIGKLGDIFGRRRLMLAGIFLFVLASILCGLAPTLSTLIAGRVLQGLGAAAMMALTVAFAAGATPKGKAGRAMGLLGAASAIGTALGPSLGGFLVAAAGWRALFLVNVPLGLLALWLAYIFLPRGRSLPRGSSSGLDIRGTLILAATLVAYALAMTVGGEGSGTLQLAFVLAAGLGLALFLVIEARAASPLIPLQMFRDPALSAGLASTAIVSTVVMSTLVVGPFYLSHALGLETASVGLVLSVGPVVVAVGGVPAGHMVDRLGARRMSLWGLTALMAGCLMLALMPATLGLPGYIPSVVLITLGYAIFQTANNTSVMAGADPQRRGMISGLLNLSRNLGLITGASAMGALFAAVAGGNDMGRTHPQDVAVGMQVTFGISAILALFALALVIGSGRSCGANLRIRTRQLKS